MEKILRMSPRTKVKILCFICVQMIFWLLSGSLASARSEYFNSEQDILAQKVSLNMQSKQMKKVLLELEKQANVKFVFSNYTVKSVDRVSLNVSNEPLSVALNKLFTPLSISYSVVGSRILLRKIDNRTGAVQEAVNATLIGHSSNKPKGLGNPLLLLIQ
jgi:TonB-dependent starch-binding outer membrane protein SusC